MSDELDTILDDFMLACGDKPDRAVLTRFLADHPEHVQDISEFAALWEIIENAPPAPELPLEENEALRARGMEIVRQLLNETETTTP